MGLLDRVTLDASWYQFHAPHAIEAEAFATARRGAVAGLLSPVTSASLGDVTFDAPPCLAMGDRFGVGTYFEGAINTAGELRRRE